MPVWVKDQELLELTEKAVESFEKATPGAEVIVVDNGSTFGMDYLREAGSLYIRNKENLGFATAVRQGWLLASSNIVATVNNDIKVAPNWLEVVEPILSDPIVGTVHPRMIDYEEPFKYGQTISYRGKERWCTFSFFVLTKDFLARLAAAEQGREPYPGVMDANYKINSADWDFCHRVRRAGFRQVYTDKTAYQHKHSSTQLKLGDEKREELERLNREYFKNKFGEYPEILFAQEFPDQMKVDYKNGFKL